MSELPPLTEELAPGDQSDHVFAMQQRLAEFGYFHDSADGVFGESTEDAIREFQRNYGLPEDGRVGPETWAALDRETSGYAEPESAGSEVGELSEDGQWRWDGSDWQAATTSEPTDTAPGTLSEDGHWRWDGEQWQAVEPDTGDEEMSTEQFQELIAQSMQVNSSDMA